VRYAAVFLLLTFAVPGSAHAETPVEIGTTFGMTIAVPSDGGDAQLILSAPSGTFLGLGAMYITVIAGERWMIEPQILVNASTERDDVLFSGMFQLGYLFSPQTSSSLYIAAHVGQFHVGADVVALGAAVGTRKKLLGGAAAVRGELRYRIYLDDAFDLNELALNVGLGVVL